MRHARDPALSVQRDAEEVDAPDQMLKRRMSDEIRLSRRKEPPLLGRRYRLFGLNQPAPPDLDLDKDENIVLTHDEIEFPDRAAPLFRQAGVASGFELPAREALSSITQALALRARYDLVPQAATGEKQRRWWMLGPCSASRVLCRGEQYPLCNSKP